MNHTKEQCKGLRMTSDFITYLGGNKRARDYFVLRALFLQGKAGR